jgi:alpha-beta hydrolase superfamily lysophospholipase
MGDGALLSDRDGSPIRYRVTAVDDPEAVVVLQLGTLSKPVHGDLMAQAFAARGIKTYAIASRAAGAPRYTDHADDLQQVVTLVRAENPGVPVTVMGVSIGATTALEWNARHNAEAVPVVAMAPVVMSKLSYLGPRPLARVVGGVLFRRIAVQSVKTPLAAGVKLTTNSRSEEYHPPRRPKSVPASLFGDVARMLLDITRRSRRSRAPILVVLAGEDAVGYNSVARLWSHIFPRRLVTRRTVAGAAHDLSQETNHPELVGMLTDWTGPQAGGRSIG